MKAVAVLFAVLFSAQVAADCSGIGVEPSIPTGQLATGQDMQKGREDAVDSVERRKAYLDCLRPAPFAQERIVIDMEDIADEFNRERERFPERDRSVAAN